MRSGTKAIRLPARAAADAPSASRRTRAFGSGAPGRNRREILRRVSLATDFIHSNYDKPLMLGDMAQAAFLSRHHFLRLFKRIHDVTPHDLQRKRTTVAARLLRGTELAVEDIVKQVGFDSRSTLFRALRPSTESRRANAVCAGRLAFMGGIGTAGLTPSLEVRLKRTSSHDSSRCLMRSCWSFS